MQAPAGSTIDRHGLAGCLDGAVGWRRVLIAAGLGVLAAGAMAPLHLVFLLIPALAGLLRLIHARSPGGAFAVGFAFGVGHFAAGMYWLGNAFFVDAERFAWLAPFAVLGIAAILAVFPGLAALAQRRLAAAASGPGRVLVFAALWTASEWLRGWILTGLPWNLTGAAWGFSDAMMQGAALAGVYGLSLLTVAVAAMPATLRGGGGWGGEAAAGRSWRPTVLAMTALALAWAGGGLRLALAPAIDAETAGQTRLRLVQANIAQADKWKPELRFANLEQLLRLSGQAPAPGAPGPTVVIWPETAATYVLEHDAAVRATVARGAPPGGILITGAPRTTAPGETPYRVWNSLHALNDRGRIVATYDKHHLVPFGEYAPFRRLFNLEKLTAGSIDFSPGPGLRTLRIDGLAAFSPLICYEAIFPGRVSDRQDRPKWLLNLTNDAWYGISAGPYQHFVQARLRAVEEGLPLVRVANTGISAVVDGYGRTVAKIGLGTKGILDSTLPYPLKERTLYGRLGDTIAGLLIVLSLATGLSLPGELRSRNA